MSILKNIYDKYFCVNPKNYGLGIDVEINKILFFITLGICAACIVINYYNFKIGLIIKKLTRANAFSEESAKSLDYLGLSENKSIIRILSKDTGTLKRMVYSAGEKKTTYEEYITLEKEKKLQKSKNKQNTRTNKSSLVKEKSFYILENMKDYSENWLRKNDSSLLKKILFCILILLFYTQILFLMPSLLSIIGNILS